MKLRTRPRGFRVFFEIAVRLKLLVVGSDNSLGIPSCQTVLIETGRITRRYYLRRRFLIIFVKIEDSPFVFQQWIGD